MEALPPSANNPGDPFREACCRTPASRFRFPFSRGPRLLLLLLAVTRNDFVSLFPPFSFQELVACYECKERKGNRRLNTARNARPDICRGVAETIIGGGKREEKSSEFKRSGVGGTKFCEREEDTRFPPRLRFHRLLIAPSLRGGGEVRPG